MKKLFILVAMLNVSSINISAEEELLFNLKNNKILPANEAFKLETSLVQDTLKIKWRKKLLMLSVRRKRLKLHDLGLYQKIRAVVVAK